MFVTAICILFLVKLRWPKNKSLYDSFRVFFSFCYLLTITYSLRSEGSGTELKKD